MKKRLLSLVLAFTVVATLAACGGNKNGQTAPSSSEESSSAEKATEGENTETKTEKATKAAEATEEEDLGDYHVKINNAVISVDSDGNQMIVIHYDFTNNSDDSEAAYWALTEQAFQNGIELDTAYAYDNPDYDDDKHSTEVQPGYTLEDCQCAFVISDASAPVEFQIYGYDDDYNKVYAKKTFEL